jgi:hypothetical protein
MARYYFHIKEGDRLVRDEEGMNLPDLPTAKREALLGARELLAEAIKTGQPSIPNAFVIADEVGHALDIIPLEMFLPKPFKQ